MAKMNYSELLTDRELEILHFLAEGWDNKRIAATLCLTVRTVKFHTGNIYARLRVGSRSEAIVWAWKHGEIQNRATTKSKTVPKYSI